MRGRVRPRPAPLAAWRFLLLLLLLSLLGSATNPLSTAPVRTAPPPHLALVGTLDGALHAVETQSGNVLWSADVGGATVRSFQDVDSLDLGVVVPGSDGSIYVQSEGALQRFPISVPEFVDQGPLYQVLPNGRRLAIVGSSASRVFQIDAKTGEVLRTFSSLATGSENEPEVDFVIAPERDVVLVSRNDFRVRAFDEVRLLARSHVCTAGG
jgi:outer membrane protein assembly factor BamB